MSVDDRLTAHEALRDKDTFQNWTDIQTRHLDVDLMGHVNHAVMATYFELARMTVMEFASKPSSSGLMLGDLHIRYLSEVNIADDVTAGTKLTRVGNGSFTIGQGLFVTNAKARDVCAATSLSTLVHVDRATRRSAPLPDEYRRALEALL